MHHSGATIGNLLKSKTQKAYYFDTYEYARYFPKDLKIDFAFGDVNTILDFPKITKSRPIHGNNENNILTTFSKDYQTSMLDIGKRPWGKYYVLANEPHYTLKRIEVNPGQKLSYPYHHKRQEQWTIIEECCDLSS